MMFFKKRREKAQGLTKQKQEITWSQWLDLLRAVEKKGIRCEEWNDFSTKCPSGMTAESDYLLEKELANLETTLLKKSVKKMQTAFNECMEDMDLFILEKGLLDFKKEIAACFFFQRLEGFPERVSSSIGDQVAQALRQFVDDFMAYVKKMDENGTNDFLEDVIYLCRKAKLKKYVEEFDAHG